MSIAKRRGNARRSDPCGAFTIVEMVVVLAILAIVGSMMLPGLAKAKARAQAMKCLSNMRQWGIALNVYASDNDDQLPRDGTDGMGDYSVDTLAEDGPGSPLDPYAWFNVLPPGIDQLPFSNYWVKATHPRQDLPFPGSAGSFWHCPAARSTPDDPFLMDGRFGFFSLVMNQELKLLGKIRGNAEPDTFAYPSMPRLGAIPNPAVTVLLTDVAFSPTLEPYTPDPQRNGVVPAGRSAQFSQRHSSRGANIVFVDGHASFFKRSYITNAAPTREEKLNPDVVWNPNRMKF